MPVRPVISHADHEVREHFQGRVQSNRGCHLREVEVRVLFSGICLPDAEDTGQFDDHWSVSI